MVKDVQNIYLYTLKKKNLFGCFRIEEESGDDNETSLKERTGIEIKTTVLPLRDVHSFVLYFTYLALNRAAPPVNTSNVTAPRI